MTPTPYTATPPPLTQEELDALAAKQQAMGGAVPEGGYVAEPAAAPADPAYAPVEPGMYDDPYVKPGQNADPEPLPPLPQTNPNGERGLPVEPGMYQQPYTHPGLGNPSIGTLLSNHAVEPGMYEDAYVQPGQYATRDSASSYYGGEVWPPMWRGADNTVASIRPNPSFIQITHPATGAPAEGRTVPNLGTATVVQPGPAVYPPRDVPDDAASVGDLMGAWGGGSAPPHPSITLGPSALEMGHHYQQGDPGVVAVPRLVGDQPHEISRRDLAPPTADELKGLFGGGEQVSSQPMPLPPGAPKRGRNSPPLRRR